VTLLKVVFESKTSRMKNVKCTLKVGDNDKKNVNFFTGAISETIFTNSVESVGLF